MKSLRTSSPKVSSPSTLMTSSSSHQRWKNIGPSPAWSWNGCANISCTSDTRSVSSKKLASNTLVLSSHTTRSRWTGVSEWPPPTNKKEVQSFVGFINFYRRFIPNFSQHARPLFDLTMKDVRFIWGSPQEDAFVMLKGLVTSTPVLALPDSDLPYRLEADASGVATGAVLSQQSREDSKWHPVSFLSKALSPVERNYEIHDVEMLEIIRGLEERRHYLEGLAIQLRSSQTTRTSNTFESRRSSIAGKLDGRSTYLASISRCNTSLGLAWARLTPPRVGPVWPADKMTTTI